MLKALRRMPGLRKLPKVREAKAWKLPGLEPAPRAREGPAEGVDQREDLERYAWPRNTAQGAEATLPERIILKWLIIHGIPYDVQWAYGAGARQLGGGVVDFVVYTLASRPVGLRVMGDYWHGPERPGTQRRDDAQAAILRVRGYLVADVWEHDIYAAARGGWLTRLVRDAVARA